MDGEFAVEYIVIMFFINVLLNVLALLESPPHIRRIVFIPILVGIVSAGIVGFFYANLDVMRSYGTSLFRLVFFLDELGESLFVLVAYLLLGINIIKSFYNRIARWLGTVVSWIRSLLSSFRS